MQAKTAKAMTWVAGAALAAALAVGFGGGAGWASSAHEGHKMPEDRAKLMKGMGGAMRTLKGFVEGRKSAEEAAEAAALLSASAPEIPDVFPPDTGMGTNPESEAKDLIWEEWDEFTAAIDLLVAKAATLEEALASGDAGAAAAAFGDLGKNGCGGCHRRFREKRS